MQDDLLDLLLGCGCKKKCCCQKPTPPPPTSGGNLFQTKGKGSPSVPPPDDPPFIPPPPVFRSLGATLPTRLPSAGLTRSFNHWRLNWSDGWAVRSEALPDFDHGPRQSSGALLAADGGALAVVAKGSAIPLVEVTLYRVPPVRDELPMTTTPLPPPFTDPNDPVQGSPQDGRTSQYVYGSSVTAGPDHLRVVVSVASVEHQPVPPGESYPVDLLVCTLTVNKFGVVSPWTIFPWRPVLPHWNPTHVPTLRTAGGTDGAAYLNLLDRWWKVDATGMTEVVEPPAVGVLRAEEYNPVTDKLETYDLPWQLSVVPGGSFDPATGAQDRHRTVSPSDGLLGWIVRPTLHATVTEVKRLRGGLTLLTLDALPAGLNAGWLGVSGTVLPHVPGLLVSDSTGEVAALYPPGAVLTWDGAQAAGGGVGNVVTAHQEDLTQAEYAALPNHPLDRPDRAPLHWGDVFLGWVDLMNAPSVDMLPPALHGSELFPATLTASNTTPDPPLTLTPEALTVPMLTPTLSARGTWRFPPGTHTLTVTWPALPSFTRAAGTNLALKAPWALLASGALQVRLDGQPVPTPPRGRGWVQWTRTQVTPGTPSLLTVTFTPPPGGPPSPVASLQIAQLSLTTTQQEVP